MSNWYETYERASARVRKQKNYDVYDAIRDLTEIFGEPPPNRFISQDDFDAIIDSVKRETNPHVRAEGIISIRASVGAWRNSR